MDTPTKDPRPSLITGSRPCTRCRYQLRGLPRQGVCPECELRYAPLTELPSHLHAIVLERFKVIDALFWQILAFGLGLVAIGLLLATLVLRIEPLALVSVALLPASLLLFAYGSFRLPQTSASDHRYGKWLRYVAVACGVILYPLASFFRDSDVMMSVLRSLSYVAFYAIAAFGAVLCAYATARIGAAARRDPDITPYKGLFWMTVAWYGVLLPAIVALLFTLGPIQSDGAVSSFTRVLALLAVIGEMLWLVIAITTLGMVSHALYHTPDEP